MLPSLAQQRLPLSGLHSGISMLVIETDNTGTDIGMYF